MVDSESVPGRRSLLRRIAARLRREVQGWRWYRRLGRALLRGITATADEESDPASPGCRVCLRAFWRGRTLAQMAVVRHPPGLPPEMEWWTFSLEVEPAFRGFGIGEMLLRAALREAAARGGRDVYGLVRATNGPSRGMLHKCGFVVEPDSPVAAQWMADKNVAEPYLLVRCSLGE